MIPQRALCALVVDRQALLPVIDDITPGPRARGARRARGGAVKAAAVSPSPVPAADETAPAPPSGTTSPPPPPLLCEGKPVPVSPSDGSVPLGATAAGIPLRPALWTAPTRTRNVLLAGAALPRGPVDTEGMAALATVGSRWVCGLGVGGDLSVWEAEVLAAHLIPPIPPPSPPSLPPRFPKLCNSALQGTEHAAAWLCARASIDLWARPETLWRTWVGDTVATVVGGTRKWLRRTHRLSFETSHDGSGATRVVTAENDDTRSPTLRYHSSVIARSL